MKKLTAGIFTILMGLVSVNAADAAVASKGYVDKQVREAKAYAASEVKTLADTSVKANTEAISAMDTAYKQADSDLSARIDGLTGTGDQAAATKKELADAKSEALGAVKTLADTSVKANADAIAAINDEETGILKTAQTYADGKVQELANGSVKANTDAIAAIYSADNGILKQAKDYTDGKTGDVDFTSESLNVVKGAANLTAAVDLLDAEASGNRSRIATLMGGEQVEGSVLHTAAATLDSAKEYTDGAIEALDLKAISKVPAACSNATNYCVLTTNGTKFVWEVIARDGETETTPGTGEGYTDTGVTVPESEKTTVTP